MPKALTRQNPLVITGTKSIIHYTSRGGSTVALMAWHCLWDDIALQNIHARVRAPLVWMIEDMQNKILITDRNRSEFVGSSATIDWDTAGGLAPLSGIDETLIMRSLSCVETDCTLGLGPEAGLAIANLQAPTDELRPQGAVQKDEADLMPYQLHARIERLRDRDRLVHQDILAGVTVDFPKYDRPALKVWLDKIFSLLAMNQWKLERFDPGFHLDDVSIDPKAFCRYPILIGVWTV